MAVAVHTHAGAEALDCKLAALKVVPVISEVLAKLHRDLSPELRYHTFAHTLDVLHEVVLFATTSGLSSREIHLLAVAAAFHDAGFLSQRAENEPIGALMAHEVMSASGSYSDDEIALVERMILDTKLVDTSVGLRQVSSTELSKYLLDADLSNFGRDDFMDKMELTRQEIGHEASSFRRKTLLLLENHMWLTDVARQLRQDGKERNVQKLCDLIEGDRCHERLNAPVLITDSGRLALLARLPLILNSSFDTEAIMRVAIQALTAELYVEAATVFLLEGSGEEIVFWTLQGGDEDRLRGTKMPAGKGIVGWVIEQQEAALVLDVGQDGRFFGDVDKEGSFRTRDCICVPLTVRSKHRLGALQALNKRSGKPFTQDDLLFLEQFAHHLALAIENAQLYQELEERNKRLEILDKRKTEMISLIAHELRTPLSVIQTSVEMLTSGVLSDTSSQLRMSEALIRGVSRLTKLTTEINNVSLVANKGLTVKRERVSVPDLFHTVQLRFKDALQKRKLEMHMDRGFRTEYVDGDLSLLLIVFKNLISNAIRFTADGGKIYLTAVRRSGMVEFVVKDTGIGIAKDHLALIFEKFFEVVDIYEHSSGEFEFRSAGMGLGLAAVRSILSSHGSSIDVESEVRKGSAFKFCLKALD